MRIQFQKIETLPRLAWALEMERGADCVTVHHGPWVETRENFFVEGTWNDDFQSEAIESCILMGSGGRITNDQLLLVCPNHTLDRIYTYRHNNSLLASNSLPFILARANDDLDMNFLFYDALMASIIEGLEGYEQVLPTQNGSGVRLHYHCNLWITSNLMVTERPKEKVREFSSFRDYTQFLERSLSAICSNADDVVRGVRYTPTTTISSGYDSPACAVLARRLGCSEALTFGKARGENSDDSGSDIALRLGLEVRTIDRLAYRSKPNFPEAECTGGPSEFSSLDEFLEGRLLFVGFHGDKVWDRYAPPSTSIIRGDASGFGLTELRLRTGFVLIAVPFIGCTSHPSINRISNSREMKPWHLNNRYDRPIPRRLVEECGVERSAFGMKKRAAGVFISEEGVENTLSPESLQDFLAFRRQYWRQSFAVESMIVKAARWVFQENLRVERAVSRLMFRIAGTSVKLPSILPRALRVRTYGYAGPEALLFHWGVRKMVARYASSVDKFAPNDVG